MPSGSGTLRLLFTIDADDKGAQAALKSLETQLGSTQKATSGLTPDVDSLSKKLLGLSGAGGESTTAITSLTDAIGGMAGTITLGAVAAIAALAAGLAACVKQAISLGSELHDLSQVTGLSVENLSALRVAATTSGSSLQELSQSFVRFERAATEGGDKATAALERFGITSADVAKDPTAAFDTFLKTFNEIGPSAQRTADLMALFGRGGARLIPTFTELSEGLEGARKRSEELGTSLSEDLTQRADAAGDVLDRIKLQLETLATRIGGELLPALTNMATVLQDILGVIGPLIAAWGQWIGLLSNLNPLVQVERMLRGIKAAMDEIRGTPPPDLLGGGPGTKVAPSQPGLDTLREAKKQADKLAADQETLAYLKGNATGDWADYLALHKIAKGPKAPKESKAKEQKIETAEAQAQARARFDTESRLEAELQQALKADLDERLLNQDQFTDAMIASERRLAEARKQQARDLAAEEIKHAQSPDARAAVATRLADTLANIESASLIRQRNLDKERVKSNADAADKIDKENEKLAEKEKKRAEDVHEFWFKQAIAINEAIAKINPEDIKPPGDTTVAQNVIADIQAQVAALDPLTAAWRSVHFEMDQLFQAMENGKVIFTDFTQIFAAQNAELNRQIALLSQSGQGFKALALFVKSLPLQFLQQFVGQLHKMTDQFIQTGHTGPAALRQLVAGTLRALGEMASSWAAFQFALALGWLALGQYHKAALALASGIGFEVLALALGFAASKVAPKEGGGTSDAAAALQPPNTTINLGNGVTGAQLGGTPGDLFGAVIASNNKQSESIDRLWGTIAMSSPGDVVTRAASTAPNAFATGVQNASKTNATFNRNLGLNLLPST